MNEQLNILPSSRSCRAGYRVHNFRGTVVIYAAKGMTRDEHVLASLLIEESSGLRPPAWPMLDLCGFILGTAEIIACVGSHPSPWFFGEYGFLLANPRKLVTPIYCKGPLGVWDVPDEVETQSLEGLYV